MEQTLTISNRYKNLTDQEVIEALTSCINQNEIKLIQFEFYSRFAPYIFKVSSTMCRHFEEGDYLAQEITQLIFIKAFKNLNKFRIPETIPSDKIRFLIKAWLGKIGTNELKNLLVKRAAGEQVVNWDITSEPSSETDIFEELYGEELESIPNEYQIKLQEAMNQLSEKDKHIILTYASEGCINSNSHLSKSSLNLLCKTYKTTSENIRQRKKRALDKIKQYCFNI